METKSYKPGLRKHWVGIVILMTGLLQSGCQSKEPMKPLIILAGQTEKYAAASYEYEDSGRHYVFDIATLRIERPAEFKGRVLRIAVPSAGSDAAKVFGRDEVQLNLLRKMSRLGEMWEFGLSGKYFDYLIESERNGGTLQVVYGNQLEGLKQLNARNSGSP